VSNAVVEHGLDKAAILKDVSALLAEGVPTDDIVERLKLPITGRTLRNWITSEPDVAGARTRFFSEKLIYWNEQIESAESDFPLARAREAYRSWSHLAGVRDAKNFGPKQEIAHTMPNGPLIMVNLANVAPAQSQRSIDIIEGELTQAVDK